VITNPDRELWPGVTKRWLVEFYAAVAPVLVPHLAGRPLTMARFPGGIGGRGFLQNECRGAPEFVTTATLELQGGRTRTYCVVDSARSLAWVANQGAVELHPYLGEPPTAIAFDLDPQPPRDLDDARRIALRLHDELPDAVVKTSGATGLHVFVANRERRGFEETRATARAIAERLEGETPDQVSASTRPADRAGRVFVDWLQNHPRRSTIAPYSLRALRDAPGVSAPVTWEEVASDGPLRFTPEQVLERIERHGDLFAGALPPPSA
jgi:bifunctional non-homologous end joining protein LigD